MPFELDRHQPACWCGVLVWGQGLGGIQLAGHRDSPPSHAQFCGHMASEAGIFSLDCLEGRRELAWPPDRDRRTSTALEGEASSWAVQSRSRWTHVKGPTADKVAWGLHGKARGNGHEARDVAPALTTHDDWRQWLGGFFGESSWLIGVLWRGVAGIVSTDLTRGTGISRRVISTGSPLSG